MEEFYEVAFALRMDDYSEMILENVIARTMRVSFSERKMNFIS